MFILNSRFLTQNLTGVQRYGYELFNQINSHTTNIECVLPIAPDINNRYVINKQFNLKKIGSRKGHLWEQLDLPAYLNQKKKPLLLNLCSTAPLFYKNQIVTVHDLAFLKGNWHSRSFKTYYKLVIPQILKNSEHIITVSEFSKQEMIDTYGTPASKISVVYNAPFNIANTNEAINLDLKRPYLLSVGSIDPRKNLKRLIKAFIDLKQPDLTLYLIGAYNVNFKGDNELDTLIKNNASQIIFLGYRTDAELIYLYQNALCFAYPSLYEGFGLPPIEAMANGCPVVTSNVSSLPEVCGDAALYCDPLNVLDIKEKIKELVENRSLRERCISDGTKNAQKYSWELSGKSLMKIIKNHI